MSKVLLFCRSHPFMKVGPSPKGDIIFNYGFATFESDEFPDWEKWMAHPGTPLVEVIPEDSQVPEGTPDSLECPICAETDEPRSFKNKAALGSHMRAHAKE
jgi:hypothetical protein